MTSEAPSSLVSCHIHTIFFFYVSLWGLQFLIKRGGDKSGHEGKYD